MKGTRNFSETDTGKKGRRKRLLRAVCWIAGIWAVLLVALQILLSPAFLTRTVERIADDYIDGTLEFGRVSASVFRHFPNVSVTLDSMSITYPSERFAALDTTGGRNWMLRRGKGPQADTLASFDRFTVSINVLSLIGKEIRIPYAQMKKPRIFAKSYNDSTANWNIFMEESAEEADSAVQEGGKGLSLPAISLGKISLEDNPLIVYCNKRDSVYIALRLKEMYIRRQWKEYAVRLEARTGVSMPAIGRMMVPIEASAKVSFPKDSVPAINISKFEGSVASIPVTASGSVRYFPDSLAMDVRAAVDGCRIEDVLAYLKRSTFKDALDFKTDAVLNAEASAKGSYAFDGNVLPEIGFRLNVPDAMLVNPKIGMNARAGSEITASGGNGKPVDVDVRNLYFNGEAIYMDLKGKALDIAGKDPLFDIDGRIATSLDTIATYLPEELGIAMEGGIEAEAKGRIRLSQIDPYRFYGANLTGFLRSDRLKVAMPSDSVNVDIDSLDVKLATVGNKYDEDVREGTRMLAVVAKVGKALVNYRNSFSLEGSSLALMAQNDASVLKTRDTSVFHPFGGRLEIGKITLTDSDSCSVSLSKSDNVFKISPDKARPGNPKISLKSSTGFIGIKEESNRLMVRGLNFDITATRHEDWERSKRAKAWIDSLSRVYPDVPKDSLPSFLMRRRMAGGVPEWLSEKDFQQSDPNFKLDEALSKYYKDWDFNGNLSLGRSMLRTAHFPLKTSVSAFAGRVNNNEVAINSFHLKSGSSDLSVKGSLRGLRGAVLRNGPLSLNLDVRSDTLNVNELLRAYSLGEEFRKTSAEIGHHHFEESEVPDSIEDTGETVSSPLLIVPANIMANISVAASNVRYSNMEMEKMEAELVMKERCLQLKRIEAESNVGNMFVEGFYATRSKKNLKTGFNLSLTDITAEKIIEMIPAVDTLMPMLKSFKGLLNCEMAATSKIDTTMSLVIPSLNGVIRISGKNLALVESESLFKVARLLKFKNIHNIQIKDMSVEGIISDSRLEVFPFVMSVDRYSLAMSGIQNLDQSFSYHVSVLKSPLIIRFGVDLWGKDFDNLKFKIGRAKYRNRKVPVFTSVVEQTRLDLSEAIRNIFSKGVEKAIRENERQEAVNSLKKEINYVNAATTKIEELSEEEQSQLDNEVQATAEDSGDGTAENTGDDTAGNTGDGTAQQTNNNNQ